MMQTWMPWGGTVAIRMKELIGLQVRSLIDGGCMTCMVMCGSGVRTGTEKTIRSVLLSTQQGLHRVRTGCAAVVVGSTSPGAAGQPFETGSSLATVSEVWGSGLLFPQVSEPRKARNGESVRVDESKGSILTYATVPGSVAANKLANFQKGERHG